RIQAALEEVSGRLRREHVETVVQLVAGPVLRHHPRHRRLGQRPPPADVAQGVEGGSGTGHVRSVAGPRGMQRIWPARPPPPFNTDSMHPAQTEYLPCHAFRPAPASPTSVTKSAVPWHAVPANWKR